MSQIVRICRHEEFELAHLLDNYDGPCAHPHGHSYKAEVTLESAVDPDTGMVMDFTKLKKVIKDVIPDHYFISDSRFADEDSFQARLRALFDEYGKRYKSWPFRPTAENMVCYFAKEIQARLPKDVFVVNIKLYETTNSYAEWRIEDHPSHTYDAFRKENVFYGH